MLGSLAGLSIWRPACRQLHWFGFNVVDVRRLAPSRQYTCLWLELQAQPFPHDWRVAFVRVQVLPQPDWKQPHCCTCVTGMLAMLQ